jgi:hypothetical protein
MAVRLTPSTWNARGGSLLDTNALAGFRARHVDAVDENSRGSTGG